MELLCVHFHGSFLASSSNPKIPYVSSNIRLFTTTRSKIPTAKCKVLIIQKQSFHWQLKTKEVPGLIYVRAPGAVFQEWQAQLGV